MRDGYLSDIKTLWRVNDSSMTMKQNKDLEIDPNIYDEFSVWQSQNLK